MDDLKYAKNNDDLEGRLRFSDNLDAIWPRQMCRYHI